MRSTLRVGIAGFGLAGRIFHAPLLLTTPGYRIDAVASTRPDAVHELLPDVRVVAAAQQLIDDPALDMVVIATPNAQHAPLAEAALRAGKHVVVDKPFTVDLAEADRLVLLAATASPVLSVFHNRRWDGDMLTVASVIASGRLGRVVHVESHFDRFRPQVGEAWRELALPGSGVWFDLGSHLLDQALQLFGRPTWLSADLAAMRDGALIDDYFTCTLGYDRLRVVLHATTLAAEPAPRWTVHGTEGTLTIAGLDPQEAAIRDGTMPGGAGWGLGAPDATLTTSQGRTSIPQLPGDYREYYAQLRDAIRDGALPPVTAAQARDVMWLLRLGARSSADGRRIALD